MSVAAKYRGSQTYLLVYQELLTAARYNGVVTYQEIAAMMGLPLSGNLMGKEVGQMLGEISDDEHAQGRPMLSAMAVGASGEPGSGFYGLAHAYGKLSKDTDKETSRRFWQQEKRAAYEAWRKKLPPQAG